MLSLIPTRSSAPNLESGKRVPWRVVLADDDPFMTEVLENTLRGLGVRNVVVAANGREALAILDDCYDGAQVVVSDLQMPAVDGLQLMRHLADRPSCCGVVLLSGEDPRILASAKALADAHGLRVLGTLTKPVRREALAEALEQLTKTAALTQLIARRPSPFHATPEDLARGIAMGELVVHYQPRVELHERQVRGVEALVRWQHPTAGLLAPGAFVPMAEESGLIDQLTRAVFARALADLAAWHRAGVPLMVSLNATVDTLARLDFPDEVEALAARCGAPLECVVIEVTESRLATHLDRVLETLTRLRLKRVGIAIDDFGTGYSTMDQLRRFPFTELKIDRAFVRGAHEDGTTRAILASSVNLARQLGMMSVAEGVETEEELATVRETGCNEVQGYFFGKPMAETQLRSWIDEWNLKCAREVSSCTR